MNRDQSSREEVERRTTAIRWWTRLDSGALSPSESEEFVGWLTRDPANKAAFDKVVRLWGDLESLRPHVSSPVAPPKPRRFGMTGASAFAVLALALLFWFDDLSILWRAHIRTGTGEVRIVTLEDGSHVQLNANSAIAVDYSDQQRRLTLLEGEAWFEISPDPARPFSVVVAGRTVTALGTSFDIVTDNTRTEVTVAEHRVRISSGGPNVIVGEGQQSAFGPGLAVAPPYPVDVDTVTAWRRGKLIFEDKSLGEVIAALRQYHRGYLLIVDPAIRQRRVTGVFEIADPLGAVRALERSLGLHVTYLTDYLVLLRG